jgi:hypothetical protein
VILYRPTDGGVHIAPIKWRPKTAFIMSQLGGNIPASVQDVRARVQSLLVDHDFSMIDADSVTTGKDYLLEIWQMVLSVPLGVAIIHEGISPSKLANIFFELGWFHAYGKETIVIPVGDVEVPSDFVRTEYVR